MFYRKTATVSLSTLLAVLLFFNPVLYTMQQTDSGGNATPSFPSVALAKDLAQNTDGDVYLPVIANGAGQSVSATPTAVPSPTAVPTPTAGGGVPPQFEISSPADGQSISGYTFFSIQSSSAISITSASFKAGNQELGTDDDGSDGFQIFVNTDDLPAGSTEFSVTVNGFGGSRTESITAQIVEAPPTSATVGATGSVLASEIGSVISILPNSVPEGTIITVDELTLEETTERHGIEWERMGVTFLGAQDVQSSVPLSRPFGMVSSAGFGNRVQPGQAVVNYRIAPDADGDGVDEIVVINTASVAPNGNVMADPVAAIQVDSIQVVSGSTNGAQSIMAASFSSITIAGPPGTILDIQSTGLNESSVRGNIGIFRSTSTGQEAESIGAAYPDPDDTTRQIFSVMIPTLPAGPATLTILNKTTGRTSDPIELTIDSSPALSRPAIDIIDEFFGANISYIQSLPQPDPVTENTTASDYIALITELRTNVQELSQDPSPEVAQLLDDTARQIVNSKIVELAENEMFSGIAASSIFLLDSSLSGAGCFTPNERRAVQYLALGSGIVGGIGCALAFTGVGAAVCAGGYALAAGIIGIESGLVPGCEEPPACPPSQSSNPSGPTGMGAAPPPGGPGCGGVGGGGEGGLLTAADQRQQSSPVMVKIFSNGNATPFTGMTDPGGYFFVPFIPADEPFTALAIDTATGDTRAFTGIGPQTDGAIFMSFDFYNDDGSGATPIEIDDVIEGEISDTNRIDTYTFMATADQAVYFDEQAGDLWWSLLDITGTEIFERTNRDVGPVTLSGGIYTLSVNPPESVSGAYRFQIWNVPPADEFNIAVGDVISTTSPGAGSGNIESPGVQDLYTFTATAGQSIYFDEQAGDIWWELLDSVGNIIFERTNRDVEPVTLEAGEYLLKVDPPSEIVTTYRFQIWDVPPADEFNIAVGDIISTTSPGAGSGNIESPGVQDLYTFTAAAGQSIYFDEQAGDIWWELLDSVGNVIFERTNRDEGPVTLEAGEYQLKVDPPSEIVTTYRFQIWDVPPADEFNIAVGDVISTTSPGEGSGNIESPGVLDLYTFTATAGQSIYFDEQAGDIWWELLDSAGNVIFEWTNRDEGPVTLEAGEYLLIVDPPSEIVTTYRFQMWDVPPADEFNIAVGDIISTTSPGAGSGNIETPGVQDLYTFTATAGQSIYFDEQAGDIWWELLDSASNVIFEWTNRDEGPVTLEAGEYLLKVDPPGELVTTYRFQMWDVPPADEFNIAVGDIISTTSPGAGSGNIETPGVQDLYTFTATAGQSIYFDELAGDIWWELLDSAGNVIFERTNRDEGPVTLEAGEYLLKVDPPGELVTTYQFQLTEEP